jgi:RNA 3'-terminal phosphate cyclase (ATP)
MSEPVIIDGAHGEGGGQVLRSAVALSAITGRALRVVNIRAGRARPGLAAQHLTSVRDELGSRDLEFEPQGPPRSGEYAFDVADARPEGSAGAATLVAQTVLTPLALAPGNSLVIARGGTHVPSSPPADYLRDVWLPMLDRLGLAATLELVRTGWYHAGGGEIRTRITGAAARGAVRPLDLSARAELGSVRGQALAANLPAHVCQRMAQRAELLLQAEGIVAQVRPLRLRAASPGAALCLAADYAGTRCGFTALGRIGKPAEEVAAEAVNALLQHRASGAALERHLADQVLLPLAFASGPSTFTVDEPTAHLASSARVIEQFGLARIAIEPAPGGAGRVTIEPRPG